MARLIKIVPLKVVVEVLTGLHIGAGKDTVRIGDIDAPVVKLQYKEREGMPYIPGTSFKGKLRFLAEFKEGVVDSGKVHSCSRPDCKICKFFGVGAAEKTQSSDKIETGSVQLTRLVFRDLELSVEDREEFKELQEDPNRSFYEEKIEINIKRDTGSATPRYIERVPAGVRFEGHIMLRVFDEDIKNMAGANEQERLDAYVSDVRSYLKELFDLLNKDYLGGHGSRGYGAVRVQFVDTETD